MQFFTARKGKTHLRGIPIKQGFPEVNGATMAGGKGAMEEGALLGRGHLLDYRQSPVNIL